jgi:hypothetical protein
MSKPRTQEVDYFPHYCEHGKVLFILESNFQNDGYAVFYKIQELLAKTNGHCYDGSSAEGWEYLLSKMNIPEERVILIIEKLVAMNTLDPGLWKCRRLWMQTFIDSIEDAYSRRKVDLPSKPDISPTPNQPSGINDDTQPTEREVSGINDDIYPQSKVKESKVKESKVKKEASPPKIKHLDSVFLSEPEHKKLQEVIGQKSLDIGIERLDYSITVKGGKYKDHYKTILNWHKRGFLVDGGNGNGGNGHQRGESKAPGTAGLAKSDDRPYEVKQY